MMKIIMLMSKNVMNYHVFFWFRVVSNNRRRSCACKGRNYRGSIVTLNSGDTKDERGLSSQSKTTKRNSQSGGSPRTIGCGYFQVQDENWLQVITVVWKLAKLQHKWCEGILSHNTCIPQWSTQLYSEKRQDMTPCHRDILTYSEMRQDMTSFILRLSYHSVFDYLQCTQKPQSDNVVYGLFSPSKFTKKNCNLDVTRRI